MTMVDPLRNASFVPVPCRCGRLLRAKVDLIGTEIQCWNCHQMVVVPCPRQPGQTARAVSDGFDHFAQPQTFGEIFGATFLVILAMMIPRYGLVAGGVTLALVA